MESEAAELVPTAPPLFDEVRLAVGGFLARYSGNTRTGYASDLRGWFAWCTQVGLEPFAVLRVHIELYARWLEEDRHLARATIGRRLSTVVGFYRFAVIDGFLTESPAEHVRRPKIDTESTTLGLDRMELGAFLAQAAAAGPVDHAVACLLGLLGLRVSEACRIDIEHLGSRAGPPHRHRAGQAVEAGSHPAAAPGRSGPRPGRRRADVRSDPSLEVGRTPRPPRGHADRAPSGSQGRDHQAHLSPLAQAQFHHRRT